MVAMEEPAATSTVEGKDLSTREYNERNTTDIAAGTSKATS
jgi:hypothetical protein